MPEEVKNLPAVINKGGRPPGWGFYCEEVVEEIVERMCAGETLAAICRIDTEGYARQRGDFPAAGTVFDWADPKWSGHHPAFVERFARARLKQQFNWIDEARDTSITTEIGLEETIEHSTKGIKIKRTRKDMLGHRALKIDTTLKLLARINPALWSERLQEPINKDNDGAAPDVLIIEGGLPDNEPPPPPSPPPSPPSPPDEDN